MRTSRLIRAAIAAAAIAGAGSCRAPAGGESSVPAATRDVAARRAALGEVRAFEAARRHKWDSGGLPGADVSLGADPFDLAPLPGGGFVGILRGRSALVRLDADLAELERLPAPRSPTGLAVGKDGDIFVSGESDRRLFRYRLDAHALKVAGVIDTDARGLRDVAVSENGALHALDALGNRLLTFSHSETHAVATCRAPTALTSAGRWLVTSCLFDHTLAVWRLDERGVPGAAPVASVHHDGPFWSFDAAATGNELWVAAAGVEDHPLDRTIGSFGFIDSFLWVYRVSNGEARVVRTLNLSELGVVVPKTVQLRIDGRLVVDVTGYGGNRRARIALGDEGDAEISTAPLPPGTTAAVLEHDGAWVFANALLDSWLRVRGTEQTLKTVADPGDQRSEEERVGELLVFTTLIAPNNSSTGPLSRFTCETCHFEGGVDGRVHHTGRGNVRVSTKPLRGLGNNSPHFSRALDRDLTQVAHNEFRVAGAGSKTDPWFRVRTADVPWLAALGVRRSELSPVWLRQAFVAFLSAYHPPSNVFLDDERALSALERRGAAVFLDRCERCHQARLASDAPETRLPFDAWESALFSNRPLVWADDEYEQTGIEPYVHARGARVPSLRRLYAKWPYFTDGSARSIAGVLEQARWDGPRFWHRAPHADSNGALPASETEALLAFLRVL
jgi:hypothetical protein